MWNSLRKSCFLFATFLSMHVSSAAAAPVITTEGRMILAGLLALSMDLRGIEFRERHPMVGDNMVIAVKQPSSDAVELLSECLESLKKEPGLRIKVVGFTDDKECYGVECEKLSRRRASLVYDWLISHGISPSKLLGPEGKGSALPLDDNFTEKGRQRNRRVEFIVQPFEK